MKENCITGWETPRTSLAPHIEGIWLLSSLLATDSLVQFLLGRPAKGVRAPSIPCASGAGKVVRVIRIKLHV